MQRRCLVSADGFYEWRREGKRKVPLWIWLKNGEPFALIDFGVFGGLKKFDSMQTPLEISVLWPIPTLAWERFAIVRRTVNFAL
jgi:SOS response associated peptidase (SRAP)